jgi:hypothetical protein
LRFGGLVKGNPEKQIMVTAADFANLSLLEPYAPLQRLLASAKVVAGLISVLEPLGMRLLGASVGDVIDADLTGSVHRLRIEEVLYQPEHSLRTNLVIRR